MNFVGKTKEELIEALKTIHQEYDDLRVLYEKDITDLRTAKEKLKLSEERQREVLENSVDAAYKRNLQTNGYEYISPVFIRLTGYTPQEMMTLPLKTVIGLIHPDDMPRVERTLAEAISSEAGQANQVEYRFRHKNGEYRWFIDRFTLIKDSQNNPVALIGSINDLTERKLAEEALRVHEEKHRILLHTAMDGFWLADNQGRILEVNRTYVQMSGYSADELVTMKISDLEVNESETDTVNHFQKILSQGEDRFETRQRRKNGTTYDVEVSVQYKPIEGGLFVAFIRDITERKHAEAALLENDRLLKESQEIARLGSFVWELSTGLWKSSNILDEIFGIDETYIRSFEGWVDLIHPDWRETMTDYVVNEILGKHQKFDKEYKILNHKNRQEFWVHGLAIMEFDNTNQPKQLIGTITDITERKQVELALIDSESNLNAIVNITDDSIFLLSGNETCLILNEIGAKRLGRTREQTIGCKLADVFSPEIEARRRPFFNRALLNGEKVTFEDERNGRWMVNNLYPILNSEGQVVRLACYSRDITERKMVEQALTESEEKYRILLNGSSYGILAIDVESRQFLFSNPAICQLFGYTDEEFQRLSLGNLVPKESLDLVISEFESQMRGDKTVSSAQPCIRKDGTIFYADIAGAPIILNGRKCSVGFFIDVTERKKAQEYLMESESSLRQAQEIAMMGSWELDLINQKAKWSENCFILYGLKPFEIEPTFEYFKSRVHPDDLHIIDETFKNIFKFKKPSKAEVRILFPDGEDKWAQINLAPVVLEDELVALKGIQIDITERKKAQESLRVSEEKYRSLFENVQDVFYLIDPYGIIQDISPSVSHFSEFIRDELIGTNVFNQYYDPNDREIFLNALKKNGEVRDYEIRFKTKNGEIKVASVNASLIFDADGKPNHIDGSLRDISERKKAEQELIKAKEKAEESDRLKSAFLANMSHEIRTPMNGILGFAELLKEPQLTGEKQQNYIRIIEKSGKRMLNIINDLVSISKIEAGQMNVSISATNINDQIESVYNFFSPEVERKGLHLIIQSLLPSKEAIIKTDRDKLYAILTNLVGNAFKFTSAGSIEFGVEKKGGYFEFFVKDTGVGVPENKKKIIFERFRQGSELLSKPYEGAGLGLSISKSYVEMLSGKMWLESEPEEGSTFYFTLPCNMESEANAVRKDVPSGTGVNNQVKNLKILIAEDDEAAVYFLSTALDIYCKEILTAGTGVEAVEACRNNPDIDLVLMDIRMPEMSGIEATRQIRQFNKDVIIIAQTAYAMAGDREKSIASGCNDHLSKPVIIGELRRLMQRYFGK